MQLNYLSVAGSTETSKYKLFVLEVGISVEFKYRKGTNLLHVYLQLLSH